MDVSKIEGEILKAGKRSRGQLGDEPRQEYLRRVCSKVQDLSPEDWEKLSDEAVDWANEQTRRDNDHLKLREFPDLKAQPRSSTEDDPAAETEETEAAEAVEDGEEVADAQEQDDDESDTDDDEREGDSEDEEEVAAKSGGDQRKEIHKVRTSTARKEAPAPARRGRPARVAPTSRRGRPASNGRAVPKVAKKAINDSEGFGVGAVGRARRLICKDPNVAVDSLMAKLKKAGLEPSRATITSVRADTRATLRAAQLEGLVPKSVVIDQ